jgi:hypothetical protein
MELMFRLLAPLAQSGNTQQRSAVPSMQPA